MNNTYSVMRDDVDYQQGSYQTKPSKPDNLAKKMKVVKIYREILFRFVSPSITYLFFIKPTLRLIA